MLEGCAFDEPPILGHGGRLDGPKRTKDEALGIVLEKMFVGGGSLKHMRQTTECK